MHYAVIGAGAGGLCAAKYLVACGIEATIFEAGSRPGGLWVYNNDSGRSSAYRSLRINSESRVSSFVDFRFPANTPLYPGAAQMERYFKAYADHFDLTRRIRFKSEVTAIEPEGDQYRVTLASGESQLFDGVIAAAGHQSVPRDPPQVKGFKGEYSHAHHYRVPEAFAGKRVLVIGAGNSGVDIAADICTMAERTILSARSPVLIMPRMMAGVPIGRILARLERPWIPMRARIWLRTQLTRLVHGRMEQWGFRTPTRPTHPITHPTLISQIALELIQVKPGIVRIDGKVVQFEDGTSEEVDCIIGATGYETHMPFLPSGASPLDGTRLNLYNRVIHPSLPKVFFIGYFDVSGGSNIRMMDYQAKYISAVASGAMKLPSKAEMERQVALDHAWIAKQFPDTPRYGLELEPRRYSKALKRDYERSGLDRKAPIPRVSASPLGGPRDDRGEWTATRRLTDQG